MESKTQHAFEAEVSQVLRLVVTSLYSHREIFLRELVSNASDAIDKLRFRAIREPELLELGESLEIRLLPDAAQGTLSVWDNGIGMTREELIDNLGTIARSGTRRFLEQMEGAKQAGADQVQLIGQFGVGFYSAFLVADRVEVTSRGAGSAEAWCWSSDAKEGYSIERAERPEHGTTVVLHLAADQKKLLEPFELEALVRRYSDYVGHPIRMPKPSRDAATPAAGEDSSASDTAAAGAASTLTQINQASALWRRSAKEVTEEQYEELYKHLTHDWEAPLAHRHFHMEGTQEFSGLLFLPKRPPFDLFDPALKHGVRLHVRRVFVMDDCEELLPRWLRFMRGVVDSEDLPLNVSREILQDSRAVRVIRKQVVQQTLGLLEELAKERPDDYVSFWKNFGHVLEEGLHLDRDYKERLAALVRWPSTTREGLVSLAAYVAAMKEGQPAIYYATGASRALVEASPQLEALRERGYEVLLMTEAVDPFAVEALESFEGKPFVSAAAEGLELGSGGPAGSSPHAQGGGERDAQPGASGEAAATTPAEASEAQVAKERRRDAAKGLLARVKTVLGKEVADVRASDRLRGSPACLVVPEGGLAPHIERLLRLRQAELPMTKRILELNLEHPVLVGMMTVHEGGARATELDDWIRVLYDQALIAEGSPPEDPAAFSRRLTALLSSVAAARGPAPS